MKKWTQLSGLFLLLALAACKKEKPTHVVVDTLVKNLENPWGLVFLPNEDLVFSERTGRISTLKKGENEAVLLMARTVEVTEGGLLGMAVDPQFGTNGYLYIYETVPSQNRVVRLRYQNGQLSEDAVILDGIPSSYNHDGGALRFGPDGYLYVGTGDALQSELAQDRNSMAGKILRIDRNGNEAPGNPFNSRVWSYGHRNVQGFDWNAQGTMMATEHGPTSEFGWCCHDEVNHILPGRNYGWPLVIGDTQADTLTSPVHHTGDDTWAPSGCSFVHAAAWGHWENDLLVAGLRGQRIYRLSLSGDGQTLSALGDTLQGTFGRVRNIVQAPDGSLYLSTSNRGFTNPGPSAGDDKIYRLSIRAM